MSYERSQHQSENRVLLDRISELENDLIADGLSSPQLSRDASNQIAVLKLKLGNAQKFHVRLSDSLRYVYNTIAYLHHSHGTHCVD